MSSGITSFARGIFLSGESPVLRAVRKTLYSEQKKSRTRAGKKLFIPYFRFFILVGPELFFGAFVLMETIRPFS